MEDARVEKSGCLAALDPMRGWLSMLNWCWVIHMWVGRVFFLGLILLALSAPAFDGVVGS